MRSSLQSSLRGKRTVYNPVAGIHPTSEHVAGALTGASFDKTKACVFQAEITISDTQTPDGVIMELGGGSNGMAIVFNSSYSNSLIISAGAGGTEGDADVAWIQSPLAGLPRGRKVQLTAALKFVGGKTNVQLWLDGVKLGDDTAVNSASVWAGGADGGYGQADATVAGSGEGDALTNVTLDSKLRYYEDIEV